MIELEDSCCVWELRFQATDRFFLLDCRKRISSCIVIRGYGSSISLLVKPSVFLFCMVCGHVYLTRFYYLGLRTHLCMLASPLDWGVQYVTTLILCFDRLCPRFFLFVLVTTRLYFLAPNTRVETNRSCSLYGCDSLGNIELVWFLMVLRNARGLGSLQVFILFKGEGEGKGKGEKRRELLVFFL